MLDVDLFENIENNDVLELLQCIGIKTKTLKKGNYIIEKGQKINSLGIILSGTAQIVKQNEIIEELKTNDIFGHNIVCLGIKESPISIITTKDCEILFLPFEKVITPCQKLCKYHLQIIKNIMKMISKRNSLLDNKIDIIGKRKIREKIIALLQKYKIDNEVFTIPYTRDEMAKFLCADRCAISRELCKMRDEGILRFNKNKFELLM